MEIVVLLRNMYVILVTCMRLTSSEIHSSWRAWYQSHINLSKSDKTQQKTGENWRDQRKREADLTYWNWVWNQLRSGKRQKNEGIYIWKYIHCDSNLSYACTTSAPVSLAVTSVLWCKFPPQPPPSPLHHTKVWLPKHIIKCWYWLYHRCDVSSVKFK